MNPRNLVVTMRPQTHGKGTFFAQTMDCQHSLVGTLPPMVNSKEAIIVSVEGNGMPTHEALRVRVCGVEDPETVRQISVSVARIDPDGAFWLITWNEPPVVDGNCLLTTKTDDVFTPGLFEISQIGLRISGADVDQRIIRAGTDFPRALFEVVESGTPRSRAELEAAATRMGRERSDRFLAAVDILPMDGEVSSYRVFAFLSPCLITNRIRLDRMELIPLGYLESAEEVRALEAFFQHSGGDVPTSWLEDLSEKLSLNHPATAIHFPNLQSASKQAIEDYAIKESALVSDVLSLTRRAHGRVIGVLLIRLDDGKATFRPLGEGYRGNLLGGFISGEDPRELATIVGTALKDPSLRLFIGLYGQAFSELDVDSGFFRMWAILEGMAQRYVSSNQVVHDFVGDPILNEKGKPITTRSAQGRVYALIQREFKSGSISATPYTSMLPEEGLSLWDLCGVWVGYRNATAHYGAFDPDNAEQRVQPWFRATLRAYASTMTKLGRRTIEDPYYQSLSETAELVLMRKIFKRPGGNPVSGKSANTD